MKNLARLCFDELQDGSEYAIARWLGFSLAPEARKELTYLNGAASYLFDYFFGEKKAGSEISLLVSEDLGREFEPNRLLEQAIRLQNRLEAEAFLEEKNRFCEYLTLLFQEGSTYKNVLNDREGKLAISYSEALADLVLRENPQGEPFRICDILLLRASHSFSYLYRTVFSAKCKTFESASFFLAIDEAFEKAASEIRD